MSLKLFKGLLLTSAAIALVACGQTTPKTEANSPASSVASSQPEEKHDHDHDQDHKHEHKHTYSANNKSKFDDSEVKDRSLSDWEGDWQSIYPFLNDGSLDEVMAHKAEDGKKTAAEYKTYYEKGYKTDVENIEIKDSTIIFTKNAQKASGIYKYAGFKVLTYESGNKGVRYLYTKESGDEAAPKHIQFSDHMIGPEKVSHFHLYFGDQSNEDLLNELENWPTYFPASYSAAEVAHDMMHH